MRLRHRVLVPVAVLACAQAADLRAQTTDPPENCRGDAYAAYDYILGNWRNTEKDLGENGELEVVGIGESHIHEIVDGCGIVEHRTSYRDGAEHAGLFFLRAYDYERDRWNQVLVADFPGYIVWTVEPMDGRRTRFTTSRLLDGDTVHVRMTEEPVGPDAFRRTFESSRDGGRTWALDVVVDYTRMGSSAAEAAGIAGSGPDGVSDAAGDEAAVRAALQHYLRGHATGRGAPRRRVFHPESRLFWIRDGELMTRTSEEYIAGAPGEPAADEARRRRRIAMVDVTGTAAVAKIELDYPGVFITDYFTLLKVDGEWKIMNKIVHVDSPRSAAAGDAGARSGRGWAGSPDERRRRP